MARKKQYEACYAGYVHEKPLTYWTSSEEVKKHLTKVNLAEDNLEEGGMPIISDGKKTAYIDAQDGHTAVIASSGMKKSLCCFMPLVTCLAKAGENMIITDPKGELFNRLAGFLVSHGYNVRCLDFRTMDKDCFNPLYYPATVYQSENQDKGLSLLSNIISSLAEKQRKQAKDIFWPDAAALYMNGTGALMFDSFPMDKINILNWSDFNIRDSALLIEDNLISNMPDNTVKSALRQTFSSAENTMRSILITASSFLQPYIQNPKLCNMLSHSTFSLEDLVKPKTTLFLIIDDTTSTVDPILGMIIGQIQSFLVDKAFHNKNGKLDIRMNFVLDEFASIPLPDFDKCLATHRSRNIRYYLCIQSLALLKERYGGDPEKLLSNCTSTLFLGSTELELLKELEVKLGYTFITPDGKEKPLCSVGELMTLQKNFSYKEVIYLNLNENIRFCTYLPAIEAYGIDNYEVPVYYADTSSIESYTVAEFVRNVSSKKIRPPFSPVQKNNTVKKKKEKSNKTANSTPSIESELAEIYDEIFGISTPTTAKNNHGDNI